MAEIKLMILPSVVKERTSIHTNTDDKLIWVEIKAAQDMFIRPLLGSILFDKILGMADAPTGAYKTLLDNYLVDALCGYVMAGMPECLNYQYWNKGVATKTTEQSQSPSMSEMYAVVARYKKRAEHYAQQCRLYILAHLNDYPEYQASGGVDTIPPDRAVFTSPIYLGGSGGTLESPPYGRANHDPNVNSNDPYLPY